MFAFPFVAQVFLSLVLAQQESKYIAYIAQDLGRTPDVTNRFDAIKALKLNSAVTKFPITRRLEDFIKLGDSFVLDESFLTNLQFLLGTSEVINLETASTIEDKINVIFDTFRVNATYRQFYIDIVKANDRVKASSLIAQLLNYRKETVQKLAQYFEQWQSLRSI